MRGDTEKLVADVPGEEHRRRITPPVFKPPVTGGMKLRTLVRGVQQDIGVEDEHSFLIQHGGEFRAVGYVNPRLAASPPGQLRQGIGGGRDIRLENSPQASLDKSRNGRPAPRRFLANALHDGGINVKRRLHMDNHIRRMAVRKALRDAQYLLAHISLGFQIR